MSEESKFYLFGDAPITQAEQDKFSYGPYIDSLKRIIDHLTERKGPFNIGIYGQWGVGKTSIINLLKEKTDPKKVKLIVFNVWKYSTDSLMKQFLIFLDGKEGFNTNLKIKDELDKTTKITSSSLKLNLSYLVASIFLALLAIFIVSLTQSEITDTRAVILLAIAMVVIYLLYDFFKQGISQSEETNITQHRLDKPDQFERKLDEILEKAGEDERKKVIVIDDLDRCPPDKVVEMLGIIKAFMRGSNDTSKGCIYIIPCDEDAIKKHLCSILKYDDKDASAFLRKFFQITFKIPPFIGESIYRYTHELADKSGFGRSVEGVLIRAFWDNPRQIKLFLNNLTVLREIAERKEKEGLIGKGVITGNLAFLTKIEVIRSRWPELYDIIQKDEKFLDNLEDYLTYGILPQILLNESDESKNPFELLLRNHPRLKTFIKSTIDIRVDEISPFLKLGEPDYLSTLPEEERIKLTIITDPEEFKETFLKSSKQTENIRAVERFIKNRLNSGDYRDVFYGTLSLIEIYGDITDPSQKKEIGSLIAENLSLKDLRPYFDRLPLEKVFEVVKTVDVQRGGKVVHHFVDIFEDEIKT